MRHELFEETLKSRDFSLNSAGANISSIVRRRAPDLLAARVSSTEAKREIQEVLPSLQKFGSDFTALCGQEGGAVLDNHVPGGVSTHFLAKSVEAVEEPVITHELGLKGNVDVIVEAATTRSDQMVGQKTISKMGVELKTGHNQTTQNGHVAQLALYILMMQARLGTKRWNPSAPGAAESGVLLYMNNKSLRAVHIAPLLSEIKSLIGQRNVLATEQRRAARPRGIVLLYENESAKSRVTPSQ
jgi:hypothetical protein